MPTAVERYCPYCDAEATVSDSAEIYRGRSYGLALICTRWPECDAFVSCHPGSDRPMGYMANRELREARKKAHAAFDPRWKHTKLTRKGAYQLMADLLKIPLGQAHISHLNLEQCAIVTNHFSRKETT